MTVTVDPFPDHVRAVCSAAFGDGAVVEDGFGPLSVDVPADRWVQAVTLVRDELGCTFFDWLSAVDELGDGFRIVCHLASHRPGAVDHLVLRTLIPRQAPVVESVGEVFRGARWHERETHEMFGVDFSVDGVALDLETLLLPDEFEGHPLRKEFVLASRVAKPWPGAKEPGEGGEPAHDAPSRRRTRPAGAPDPDQWGPRPPGSAAPDPLAVAQVAQSARPRRPVRPRRGEQDD